MLLIQQKTDRRGEHIAGDREIVKIRKHSHMHRMLHQKVENIAFKKEIRTVFGNRCCVHYGGDQREGTADKIADHNI